MKNSNTEKDKANRKRKRPAPVSVHGLSCVLAILLAVAMMISSVLSPVICAYAEEEKEMTEEEKARKELLEKTYKIEVASNKISGWPKGPGTYGEAACVMDMDTGAILYDKKMNDKHYPASITKVMTAYVTCKYGDLNGKVNFCAEDISFLEPGDAAIGMTRGEIITMKDAMHAMLLHSANEVSHAIIRTVGRKVRTEGQIQVPGAPEKADNENQLDYQWGIALMNMEAQQLGCTNSHFVNSYGLHDKNHYVSAHDMCLIGAAAYQYEYFRNVTRTHHYKIPKYKKTKKDPNTKQKVSTGLHTVIPREFWQNHKMLYKDHTYYYNRCTGGKTGFTDQAGTTLVTFAEKDGKRLVSTCLHTYGAENVYKDTRKLMEYGFNHFAHKELNLNELSAFTNQNGGRKITMVESQTTLLTLPEGVDMSKVKGTAALDPSDIALDRGIYQFSYGGMPLGGTKVHYESLYLSVRNAINAVHKRFEPSTEDTPEK